MSLETLRAALPAYAKDINLNLSSLAAETVLSDQQKWGAFLASAYAVGVPAVVKAVEAEASANGLSAEAAGSVEEALDRIAADPKLEGPPRILICGSLYLACSVLAQNGTPPK